MLHIIFLILKIIGCILLGILGLVLILLLLGLFLPFKYQLESSVYEQPQGDMRLRWLFGGLRVHIGFRGSSFYGKGNFLWMKLFDTEAVTEEPLEVFEEEKEMQAMGDISEELPKVPKIPAKEEIRTEEPSESSKVLPTIERKASEEAPQRTETRQGPPEKQPVNREKIETSGLFKKLSRWVIRIAKWIEKKILGVFQFFRKTGHKKEWLEKFWNADFVQNSLTFGLKALKSLGGHICPKKMRGEICFGLGKPTDTGKVLGLISVFYPLWGRQLRIFPDFEQTTFKGEISVKGRLQIYIFVYWALRGFFNKDIRKLIKYIKHSRNREETLWQ